MKINIEKINIETILENAISLLIVSAITGFFWLIYNYREQLWVWLKRCKLKIFPIKFNVALSIQFDKQLNSGTYFNEIKKNLFSIIEHLGLVDIISIKDFSDIYLFPNQKEAEEYRQKKKLDLIIWGNFSTDGLKIDGGDVNKITLNFTYSYPRQLEDKENQLGKAIILDISHKLAIKNYWQILEDNSLRDIQIVSNNLMDISLYIIGLTLKFYGRLNESVEIFEKLYFSLTIRKDNFRNLIIPHLLDCYWLFVRDVILRRKNSIRGKYFCEKILSLDEKNYFALVNLPLFLYRLNKRAECEIFVEKLLKLYPKDPHTEVDVAFIRILQKNYKNAFKHYNRLIEMEAVSFNPQEVIDFLGQEYQKFREPALLYGSAILSYYWGDKLLAKEDFSNFLRKANERDYKEMYRKAEHLLSTIKNL